MLFKVKVKFVNLDEDIDDMFYSVYVNEDAEMLLLFKEVKTTKNCQKVMRYAIPLNVIDWYEVTPYEDNEQKIPRC